MLVRNVVTFARQTNGITHRTAASVYTSESAVTVCNVCCKWPSGFPIIYFVTHNVLVSTDTTTIIKYASGQEGCEVMQLPARRV